MHVQRIHACDNNINSCHEAVQVPKYGRYIHRYTNVLLTRTPLYNLCGGSFGGLRSTAR